jgi:hypothetical protein
MGSSARRISPRSKAEARAFGINSAQSSKCCSRAGIFRRCVNASNLPHPNGTRPLENPAPQVEQWWLQLLVVYEGPVNEIPPLDAVPAWYELTRYNSAGEKKAVICESRGRKESTGMGFAFTYNPRAQRFALTSPPTPTGQILGTI